jgi:serine/threonine protein kinase
MNAIVDGKYQIIKRLGKGGFAHTYLAKNLSLPGNPSCVVKQLRPKTTSHPWMVELFKLEAKILSQFDHQQIPQQVDEFEHGGDLFFVQELVTGDDLSKEFTIGHRWNEAKIIEFLKDILPTIAHIHERQVIHCDLKPQNILRRWDTGRLVPIDFGAAREISKKVKLAHHQVTVGTPGYCAPERSEGRVSPACDIYSLGMCAIQFATGQYPVYLPLDDRGRVVWRNLTPIDPNLADIIDRMVAPDPVDRYADTTIAISALDRLPVSTFTESTPTEIINRTSQRLPSGRAIAVAALVLCGMTTTISYLATADRSSTPQFNLDREPHY